MARNYKSIEYLSGQFESNTYYKNQKFTNSSEGINSIQYRSESLNFNESEGPFSYTTSGSHYNFIKNFLFDSSSFQSYGNIFKNKFDSSGSVIYIPQQYYGEEIKPKTFQLIDTSQGGNRIVILDDGNGNLYSSNAKFSQSADSHASSSDNYIGNIHYQTGIVMITETGSWSGSVGGNGDSDINYTSIGTGNFEVAFNATHTIHTNEIVCDIQADEFTATSNTTIWSSSLTEHKLANNISSSIEQWSPYATSIAFYDGVPDVYNRKSMQTLLIPPSEENQGGTQLTWFGPPTTINKQNIPNGITQIAKVLEPGPEPGGAAAFFSTNLDVWVGNLTTLEPGMTYEFNNITQVTIEWLIDNTNVGGSPVLVAHFPRPVKIDRLSNLKIVIRYDT